MLRFFLHSIKMGYIKAFDCYGKDSKWQYLCIMTFQLAWFLFYLWIPYRSDYAIVLFLLFFIPVISSNTRCINYYGFSRAVSDMAGCSVHHAFCSAVFDPTPKHRRELSP